ncbi:MAG: DNA polymerase III subunit alpha, partial [Calditrichaeota bacterium]|nr:DNA polymerase III subunit alpha [Calditrichota bacterium]
MGTSFIHLHCHSNYSFLDSTLRIDDMIRRAAETGAPALALTDTNRLTGAIEFYQKAREAGIHPIIGAEINLVDAGSVVLLARNRRGYQNLSEIITRGHLAGGAGGFQVRLNDLKPYTAGLVALSGGKRNPGIKFLRRRRLNEAVAFFRKWQSIFGKQFYIELQNFSTEDDWLNLRVAALARELKIPVVATNNVHLLKPSDWEIWRTLQAIDQNTTLEKVVGVGSPEQFLKSPGQMRERFRKHPDALLNTLLIAKSCQLEFSLGKPVFPGIALPRRETPFGRLQKLCYTGLHRRYSHITPAIRDRLNRELLVVRNLGFVEYFLIVKTIVDFCRKENIPCVGRGSAADSLIAYTLDITQADPIRFNLYFERFLNAERAEPPDIDLDICWKNRDRVLTYVYEKFGHDKTALIATIVTFQMRSSIREVAKTFGIPEEEISRFTKRLPHRPMKDFRSILKTLPELKGLRLDSRLLERIFSIAARISGFPRHLSVHPGGTVIAPKRITHFAPLEQASGGWVITQYDMHSVEKLGLVKMDLLGVRSLTILSEAAADIQKRHGRPVKLNDIPEDDPETLQMLREGKGLGCFQLESPAMRGLLKKMQIESLDDIIAAISLIRPGPAEGGMKEVYIRRRAGLEPTTYPHPLLEPILKETYGIILYQEQVLQVAQTIGGLTLGEADVLRKLMTKSRSLETVRHLRDKFLAGARRNGVDVNTARKIFDWLTHFASYGFNKAHSATYGILAYQTAFLKRHFPAEYMAALLNNPGGYYPLFAYVEEARRLGLSILPPDVNRSAETFSLEGNGIRVGLGNILNLSRRSIGRILSVRKDKSFQDVIDFLTRSQVNLSEAERLIQCGALAGLDTSEPRLLATARIFFKTKKNAAVTRALSREILLPPYPIRQKVIHELHHLGFSVTE